MCSAASFVFILEVIAESLTNALGCERSESESSVARATTGPSNMPIAMRLVAKFCFVRFPLMETARWGRAFAAHAKHVGDQFLSHHQFITLQTVQTQQQPPA